jgi:hypothetical protein
MKRKKALHWTLLSSSENLIDPDILNNIEDPFNAIVKDISKKLKNKTYKKT